MDVTTLSADTARRFRAVAETLVRHGKHLDVPNPSLLDVGGYPGTFARAFTASWPRWRATTLDQVNDNLPDYVTASGAKIPFQDASFAAVTSIDTFEHIPADKRDDFLAELCRVSSDFVVLTAPFHHPATAAIEKLYAAAHQKAFRTPHPWLDEHVRYGLPNLDAVLASWPRSHGVIEVMGSYDLGEWAQWQALSLLNKLKGETDNLWKAMEQAWAALPAPPVTSVPYRWIIFARRGAASNPMAGSFLPPAEAGMHHVEAARLQARLLEMLAEESAKGAVAEGPLVVDQRLKDAILANEKEIERLKGGSNTARPETPSALQRVSSIMKRFGG